MTDKQKILIVDDRQENLVALRQVLSDLDAEIIEATTGNQALTSTLDHHFALAILDVVMPGMNGYELAEHLRGDRKTQAIPIVFVTASYADEHHQFKGYQAGGIDYIVKPYAPEVLLGKVKVFLEMDRDKRELQNHRDQLETLVAQRTAALEERVMEVQCLYAISSLVAMPGESIDKALQTAVNLIPQGWQYPDITRARITLEGQCFISKDFRETAWKQSTDIVAAGKTVGMVEVGYLEPRPERDEGPFSREQRELIDDIARQLGVMIQREKTEQERERLLWAIEQAGEMIIITDPQGIIQYINPAFERTTGYSRQEALGQSLRLLRSDQHDQSFYQNLWADVAGGRTFKGRMPNKRKDGTLLTVEATISPVRDASGRIANFVAVKHDITEQLKLTAQLQQAQKLESVGRLAGGVAHDFNNLLSVILGNSEIALSELYDEHPLKEPLQEILEAANRARNLTRQLLAFSRKQVLEVHVVDVRGVVSGFEKLIRRMIGEDIELVLALGSRALSVKADAAQLEQVLMNLAVNARDAMPGGGTLRIATSATELDETYAADKFGVTPGAYVMISVSDTGTGMDDKTFEHLFEPFFTTKGLDRGTGLGLATSYGIVKQHGGNIWVYSEPGRGTVFKIYLPLAVEKEQPAAPVAAGPEPVAGPATILVVEDDQSVRKLACNILVAKGYRVLSARSAGDAVEMAQTLDAPIHLLLTDIVMPGMNGPEVHHQIANLHPRIKVLYMSGYTADMIARQGILNEGVQFIQKPFTVNLLLEKVAQVLS
jgi:PAS domain S-box-containing protein